MCTVSVVIGYGQGVDKWTRESYEKFHELIEKAREFDKAANQENCPETEKEKWLNQLKDNMNQL
jgi:hypothetical protein